MTHDHVTGEVVITATEFKAKCLDLLDRVRSGAVKSIRITKRGQDVGLLIAPSAPTPPARDRYALFGSMKGTVTIPPSVDIVGPIYDPEIDGVFEAEHGRWAPDRAW